MLMGCIMNDIQGECEERIVMDAWRIAARELSGVGAHAAAIWMLEAATAQASDRDRFDAKLESAVIGARLDEIEGGGLQLGLLKEIVVEYNAMSYGEAGDVADVAVEAMVKMAMVVEMDAFEALIDGAMESVLRYDLMEWVMPLSLLMAKARSESGAVEAALACIDKAIAVLISNRDRDRDLAVLGAVRAHMMLLLHRPSALADLQRAMSNADSIQLPRLNQYCASLMLATGAADQGTASALIEGLRGQGASGVFSELSADASTLTGLYALFKGHQKRRMGHGQKWSENIDAELVMYSVALESEECDANVRQLLRMQIVELKLLQNDMVSALKMLCSIIQQQSAMFPSRSFTASAAAALHGLIAHYCLLARRPSDAERHLVAMRGIVSHHADPLFQYAQMQLNILRGGSSSAEQLPGSIDMAMKALVNVGMGCVPDATVDAGRVDSCLRAAICSVATESAIVRAIAMGTLGSRIAASGDTSEQEGGRLLYQALKLADAIDAPSISIAVISIVLNTLVKIGSNPSLVEKLKALQNISDRRLRAAITAVANGPVGYQEKLVIDYSSVITPPTAVI